MTIDERLEAIAMHLEVLTHVHQDLEKKHESMAQAHGDFEKRMTEYAAGVKDAIERLTNITEAHDGTLDDHENRIDDLEKH